MDVATRDVSRWPIRRIVAVGAVVGIASGMMMAAVEMVYGWISATHTFWDAPIAIWAWVAGLDHFGQPANHVWPIVLGIGGHMMNSVLIGILFVALVAAARLRGAVAVVMFGVLYAVGAWALMRYGILPLRSSTKTLFTTATVSPQWVWWVAHAALGMTAGLAYLAAARTEAAVPARFGQRRHVPHVAR